MRKLSISGFITTVSAVLWLLVGLAPAAAVAANISHAYDATVSIPNGSLVSLDAARSGYVEPANVNNGSGLLGVSTASSQSLLAINAASGTVQVATTGVVNALVSTFNGDIKVGDQIGVTPFNGVGAKAAAGSHIVGLAQTAFSSASQGARQETVTDKQGKAHRLYVGFVRLNIAVGVATSNGADQQLNGLQKFVQSITGHVISTARIIIALIVTLIAVIALITLVYASIYSAIISVGRNPLAKYAVYRTLTATLLVAVIMAAVASLIVILLLS